MLDINGTGAYDRFKSFQAMRPFLEEHLPCAQILLQKYNILVAATVQVLLEVQCGSFGGDGCPDGTLIDTSQQAATASLYESTLY